MKCDDVFDVLTRGPFPSGASDDAAVEQHLAACHDCRKLAEALRPAVDLFHESLHEEERLELPGYEGQHAEDGASITTAVMTQIQAVESLPAAQPMLPPRSRFTQLWQLVAAGVIGLALSASLLAISGRDEEPLGNRQVAAVPELTTASRNLLAKMKLPISCASFDSNHQSQHMRGYKCCTQCHAADRQHATNVKALRQILVSCSTCHASGGDGAYK